MSEAILVLYRAASYPVALIYFGLYKLLRMLVTPIAWPLVRMGVTADDVTNFRQRFSLPVTLVTGTIFLLGNGWPLLISSAGLGITDIMDGLIAKWHRKPADSPGARTDCKADKILFGTLYLFLVIFFPLVVIPVLVFEIINVSIALWAERQGEFVSANQFGRAKFNLEMYAGLMMVAKQSHIYDFPVTLIYATAYLAIPLLFLSWSEKYLSRRRRMAK